MPNEQPQWEYKEIVVSTCAGTDELRTLGEEGWEAVALTRHGEQRLVLLRRPLTNASEWTPATVAELDRQRAVREEIAQVGPRTGRYWR